MGGGAFQVLYRWYYIVARHGLRKTSRSQLWYKPTRRLVCLPRRGNVSVVPHPPRPSRFQNSSHRRDASNPVYLSLDLTLAGNMVAAILLVTSCLLPVCVFSEGLRLLSGFASNLGELWETTWVRCTKLAWKGVPLRVSRIGTPTPALNSTMIKIWEEIALPSSCRTHSNPQKEQSTCLTFAAVDLLAFFLKVPLFWTTSENARPSIGIWWLPTLEDSLVKGTLRITERNSDLGWQGTTWWRNEGVMYGLLLVVEGILWIDRHLYFERGLG